ncbi:FHA domain-containing protein [Corallococcus carmarthensis]|uniref:FHA domain-containing protein n=1 Tax=Corallococcus carmarthensis TaxID=2316728 RepID=A0A3A8K3M5_9BACT|nr:FHA domain-containing protein [Corallococcus carmarthensis]NOK20569.1 FHA domain-containing protein [Corallococcus carmarthensis]RKG97051.1 FHA domain-containing protein [Corallococcus carmarthensis]
MVSVKQLRPFAGASLESFRAASGAVALIQQPVDATFKAVAPAMVGLRTVGMAHRSRMEERLLAMLRDFDNLEVHFLQPNQDGEEFTVGRTDACDLVVPEPSVSQHHATLRWNAGSGDFSVRDAQSMNGTFINGAPLGFKAQVMLHDGATLAFGDVQFLYLRAETLHEHLRLAVPGTPAP